MRTQRNLTPGFVNTNTGFFGLQIRRTLRHEKELRKWIHHATLCRDNPGTTSVVLRWNPFPTRNELDADLLP